MSELSFGLIAEGDYDVAVFSKLIERIAGKDSLVVKCPTGGRVNLRRQLSGWLRSLGYRGPGGGPVDKALVVTDADCKRPEDIEEQLRSSVKGTTFRFPRGIGFHAVPQEMDAWLLADTDAVNRVACWRGGRTVSAVQGRLEEIQEPKERLKSLLSEARLNYTSEVCRLIAQETDLAVLRRRCPPFQIFEQKVSDP